MVSPNEQQPMNKLAPFVATFACVDAITLTKVTFEDGSTMTTASGGSLPTDIDCGLF